ncbi:hypothetical protein CHARACLAT_030972, partial [Characodon lateralis]|nr:hypothetical protein [Characodon lateralis]
HPCLLLTKKDITVSSVHQHVRRCRSIWNLTIQTLHCTADQNKCFADRKCRPAPEYQSGQKLAVSCYLLDQAARVPCPPSNCFGTVEGKQDTMPNMPNLNSLGKLCSSSRSHSVHRVNRVRVKRKSSVKRMSIIEDGHVAEVLYLIPKQYMEQFPFLNPDDYYLSERLNDVTT